MRKLKAARYGYLLISLLFCLSAFAYWLIPARSPPVTCWDTTMRSEQNGQLFLHWSRPTPWEAMIKERCFAPGWDFHRIDK